MAIMKIYRDEKYLKSEADIEDFFHDEAYELLECGQGFYKDECSVYCGIGDKYYKVKCTAEIGSAKQNHGDRLYHIETMNDPTYEEIDAEDIKELINQSKIDEINSLKEKIKTMIEQLNKLQGALV